MYRYITKNRKVFSGYLVLLIITSATGALFAFMLSELINCAVEQDEERLFQTLLISSAFTLFSVGSGYLFERIKNRMKTEARGEIKKDLLDSLLRKDVMQFESEDTAKYLSDFLQNLDVVETLYLDNVLELPTVILSFVIAVGICLYIEPVMLLLIVLLAIVSSALIKKMTKRLEKSASSFSERLESYTGAISNCLEAFRLIKTYGIQQTVSEMHMRENQNVELAKRKNLDDRKAFISIHEFLGLTTVIIVMAAAAFFAIRGSFKAGIVIAFGQLSSKIISPIMSGSEIIMGIRSSKSIRDKYISHEETFDSRVDLPLATHGEIEVKNLSFRRGEKEIFHDLSFRFPKNSKTLVLGKNGAGKSSFLMLLIGQYGEYDGTISYGGVNIKNANPTSLTSLISYVGQEVHFIHDTVYNNITIYRDTSEETVQEVLRLCGLEEFLKKLPEGGNTVIKDGGDQSFRRRETKDQSRKGTDTEYPDPCLG